MNWIASLAESAQLSEADACALVETKGFDELTGGRKGSASQLIEILLTKAKDAPRKPSEKQLNLLKKLATKAELTESSACEMVEESSYDDLTGGQGGTASKLITILLKYTGDSGKKGKSRKS